jgi:hypothetical protein
MANLLGAAGSKIFINAGFSAVVANSFSSPTTTSWGLTWDGTNVISSSYVRIYKHVGFSTVISDSFSSPSNGYALPCWNGTNVLSCDSESNKIYKHTGFSTTISNSFSSPTSNPFGLEWTRRLPSTTNATWS